MSDVIDAEEVPESPVVNPRHPASRQKAYRLRAALRKGGLLSSEDTAWLRDYDAQQDVGASKGSKSRTVLIDEHEEAQAYGTGDAAIAAASAGNIAREEGRRYDYMMKLGLESMQMACKLHEQMAATLLARTTALEEVHLSMLDAVRTHYLARVDAEADLAASSAEEKPDPILEMATKMAPFLMSGLMSGGEKKP